MRKLVALWIAVLACAPLLSAMPGDDGNAREIEAAKKRLHKMLREAEELDEAGRGEEADRLRRKADELRKVIHRSEDRWRQKRKHDEAGEILEGLERGIKALRRLKRHEEAEHLMEIARQVKREFSERHQAHREIEIAKWQIKVMRIGVEALVKADRHDGAELLERALHACKIHLEGRRDEEAMEIRRRAPGLEEQAELLRVAADLLADWGKKEEAHAADKLSRQMLEEVRHRGEREHAREREERERWREREERERAEREHWREREEREHAEREEREHAEREHAERFERAMHEVERLHERVAHLERVIEELRDQVHALRRERR
jgi:hypothetical protein